MRCRALQRCRGTSAPPHEAARTADRALEGPTTRYQSCDPIFYKNAVYTEGGILRKKYNLPPNFILYVGTVNERKNLLGLIQALKAIENQQDINLVAIGDGGAYFQKVKKYVVENGLQKRVYFIPKIDFTDLPTIYKLARVFVLPSFFEGFGIPIIEALWSGTPVISSIDSCFSEAPWTSCGLKRKWFPRDRWSLVRVRRAGHRCRSRRRLGPRGGACRVARKSWSNLGCRRCSDRLNLLRAVSLNRLTESSGFLGGAGHSAMPSRSAS